MWCHLHAKRSHGVAESCHRCHFWCGELLAIVLFGCVLTSVGAQFLGGGDGGGDTGGGKVCSPGAICRVTSDCGKGICMEGTCFCEEGTSFICYGDGPSCSSCTTPGNNSRECTAAYPNCVEITTYCVEGNRCASNAECGRGSCQNGQCNCLSCGGGDGDGDGGSNDMLGCTDSRACNYTNEATQDDSSCLYATSWYRDSDGDSYGSDQSQITSCGEPWGYVSNSMDCDDTNKNVYALRTCGYDGMHCGSVQLCTAACPLLPNESCGNNIDDNCDGHTDETCTCANGQQQLCITNIPGVCGSGIQMCQQNSWGTCQPTIVPGSQAEVCGNNVDDDCDEQTDETCACTNGQQQGCTTNVPGVCDRGVLVCQQNSWGTCQPTIVPGSQAEVCGNDVDDDCDGQTDETCACTNGQQQGCTTNVPGVCDRGVQVCKQNSWGNCQPIIVPGSQVEACGNNTDDDCDGQIEEMCINLSVYVPSNHTSPESSFPKQDIHGPQQGVGEELEEYTDEVYDDVTQNDDDRIYSVSQRPLQQEEPTSSSRIYAIPPQEEKVSILLPTVAKNELQEKAQEIIPSPSFVTMSRDRKIQIQRKKTGIQNRIIPVIKKVALPDYPIVSNAVYVSFSSPEVQKHLLDKLMRSGYLIRAYQPFTFIDIPLFRVEINLEKISLASFIAGVSTVSGVEISFIPLFALQQSSGSNQLVGGNQWYLSSIGLLPDRLSCLVPAKEKVLLAIVDNGFATDHPAFADSVVYTYDAADNDAQVSVPLSITDWDHGTIAAGLANARKSPDGGIRGGGVGQIDLQLIKATQDSALGSDITHGIEGIVAAAEQGAQIISLSRGTFAQVPILEEVIKKITKRGIYVVAAAGNYNSSAPFYPAAYPEVISVGAYDKDFSKASFSNYGDWVDIMAPGVDIMAPGISREYVHVDGTSEAAPLVAGMLALVLPLSNDPVSLVTTSNSNTGEEKRQLELQPMCLSGVSLTQSIPAATEKKEAHQVAPEVPLADFLTGGAKNSGERQVTQTAVLQKLPQQKWLLVLLACLGLGCIRYGVKGQQHE